MVNNSLSKAGAFKVQNYIKNHKIANNTGE